MRLSCSRSPTDVRTACSPICCTAHVFCLARAAYELVTPPLDGLILPGVTRDSVLGLARDHQTGKIDVPELSDKLVVSERSVTMGEVKEASENGTLVEVFGAGKSLFP